VDSEFERLNRELIAARDAYRKSQDEKKRFYNLYKDLPAGSADAALALFHSARKEVREAWNQYQAALEAYLAYRSRR
jgi:hypothetical protein